ncbi:MAG: hypothetical protein R2730_14790 [Chitinophagales bacterium]
MKLFYTLLVCFCFLISCKEELPAASTTTSESLSIQDLSIEALLKEVFQTIPNVRDITMTNDKNEVYITVESYKKESSAIVMIYNEEGQIHHKIADFSGQYKDLEPSLSADGLKLFFASNRPLNSDSSTTKDMDIWYVERSNLNAPWSEPKNIGTPINSQGEEFFPSIALNGNLYFTAEREDTKGKEDIYVSYWKDSAYTTPISLSDSINTAGYEFNAFIAPDESFLLFSGYNRPDGIGSADLYISYRDAEYNWSKAVNLGPNINSTALDYCPFVDLETATLYFTSERSTRVDHQSPINFDQYLSEINQYENGLSRIYSAAFTDW